MKLHQSLILGVVGVCAAAIAASCSAGGSGSGASFGGGGSNGGGGKLVSGSGASGMGGAIRFAGGPGCPNPCSADQHAVPDCHGNVVKHCTGTQACDPSTLSCGDACQAARDAKRSIGCDYYATDMDQIFTDVCFAAIIANTWS